MIKKSYGEKKREEREGYRRALRRMAGIVEEVSDSMLTELEEASQEGRASKDLPGQLLKLTQLIEKIILLLDEVEPEEAEEPTELHYELVRKYLEKRGGND